MQTAAQCNPLRAADYRTKPLQQFRFKHLSHEALPLQIIVYRRAKNVYFSTLQAYIGPAPADPATVQLSVRRAAKSHRHPYRATGSIAHCLQWRCSGCSVSKPFCSGKSISDNLRAWERYVFIVRFCNNGIHLPNEFSLWIIVCLYQASNEAGAINV
ncbi:hypothetical protein CesoFtcFv8_020087 [Champsocephalus esox]|uniref:Uncharacterized protein n=1 Tax=Champsocephalus esox TaxID=159716 RepID=A0AAN8BES9_9TELE|nr:hypothetical protein CesoFtcFv8_020087 [Champsocephalus esox]